MNKHSILLLFTILSFCAGAQNFQWSNSIGGATVFNNRGDRLIAVEATGKVYTTGTFTGTSDFDPGDGVYNITGNYDIFISKLNASGNFVWAKSIGHPDCVCAATAIAVDDSGNVYLTGIFEGTVDFDPGPGIHNLTGSGSGYHFNLKLDAAGNFVWATSLWGWSYSLAIDADQNVYTTGSYFVIIGLNSIDDIFITKQNASGTFLWQRQIGSPYSNERSESIAVDQVQNIYISGTTDGISDFDPGPGIYEAGPGMIILKLNAFGDFLWTKHVGSNGAASGLSIITDGQGNVCTAGTFSGTFDFDPGEGAYNMSGANDIFIWKLNASGNFLWAKSVAGGSSDDRATSLTRDASGYVYITGYFGGESDFDPGEGAFNLTSAGSADIFILKLNASGVFEWARGMGGADYDRGFSIEVDAVRNIYTLGTFRATADFDPGTATFPLTATGDDIFISKLCSVPSRTTPISGPALVAAESLQTYSVNTADGATGYVWTVPSKATLSEGQNTPTIKIKFTAVAGEVTVTPGNSCGSASATSLMITIDPTTAVDNLISENGFAVYPNPVAELIMIRTCDASSTEYWVADHTGREVIRGKLSTPITSVDISQLAAGLYLVTIVESGKQTIRIVKQ